MSDKIDLYEGLSFTLPKRPPLAEIQGYELSKKKQKWFRTTTPEKFDTLPYAIQEKFVLEEFRRRREGHWFFINGVATYVTGHNYFYLNWCKFSFGYPEYRDVDRRAFYFWQICEDDENCYGELRVKFRRLGATSQGEAIILNITTLNKDVHSGILSKTGNDASQVFAEIADIVRGLPDFFIPLIDGKDAPKKELNFRRPSALLTRKNSKISRGAELNSRIDWKTTVENAYDGRKMKMAMFDEGGKFLECDFERLWEIHKPCFSTGRIIRGKCYLPSTVNEIELKGGKAYKKIWDDSNPNKRDANGRTLSGLYRYFSPADDGLEGFIDEFGMSMRDEANTYLNNIEDSLQGDTAKLNEHRRQFPRKVEDAFRLESKLNPYDLTRIYDQIDWNAMTDQLLTQGNFVWKNAERDTEVEFVPDKKGKFFISWFPEVHTRNNFRLFAGKRMPANTEVGCFGVDPFDHRITTEKRKSNGACYGFKKFNPMQPYDSNVFVSEYIERPPDPETFYEDLLMQCVYFGWEILAESNKPGIINYFTKRGYRNYLMDRPAETENPNSRAKQEEKGLATTVPIQAHIVEINQSYIYNNVGWIEEKGKDNRMGKCYFDRLLKDWAEFDPSADWTARDAMVAAGYALMGSRKYVAKKVERKTIKLFETYNHSGITSVRTDDFKQTY